MCHSDSFSLQERPHLTLNLCRFFTRSQRFGATAPLQKRPRHSFIVCRFFTRSLRFGPTAPLSIFSILPGTCSITLIVVWKKLQAILIRSRWTPHRDPFNDSLNNILRSSHSSNHPCIEHTTYLQDNTVDKQQQHQIRHSQYVSQLDVLKSIGSLLSSQRILLRRWKLHLHGISIVVGIYLSQSRCSPRRLASTKIIILFQ